MTMRKTLALLVVGFAAATADAHIVTIFPSTCAVTMGLSAPASGLTATVDAPAADDLLRVVYDPESNPARSRIQVCPADPIDPQNRCGASQPRGFTLGAQAGSIAFPAFFATELLSSGEMREDHVPITVTLDGTPVAVATDFTTGFAVGGGTLALGAPIDGAGAFTLVGVGRSAALPAPLADVDLLLTLSCTLAPVPDLDQFALAPGLTKVGGVLTSRTRKLSAVLETAATLPPAFDAAPTTLRLGPEPLVELRLDAGLAPAGRKGFTGAAADGSQLSVKPLRRRGGLAYRVQLRGPGVADLAAASSSAALVLESGGLVARTAVAMRSNRAGTRVKIRLP